MRLQEQQDDKGEAFKIGSCNVQHRHSDGATR